MNLTPAARLLANLEVDAHDFRVRLVLRHGQTFPASPLPGGVQPMKAKCCYLNAYTLAAGDPRRFTYYEGFGTTVRGEGWPVLHAWCVDADEHAVDPTWWGLSDPPAAYRGLPLPLTLAQPHAYEFSRDTLDAWSGRADTEAELVRLLRLDAV